MQDTLFGTTPLNVKLVAECPRIPSKCKLTCSRPPSKKGGLRGCNFLWSDQAAIKVIVNCRSSSCFWHCLSLLCKRRRCFRLLDLVFLFLRQLQEGHNIMETTSTWIYTTRSTVPTSLNYLSNWWLVLMLVCVCVRARTSQVILAQSSMHHVAGIMYTTCMTWFLRFDLLPCVVYIHNIFTIRAYVSHICRVFGIGKALCVGTRVWVIWRYIWRHIWRHELFGRGVCKVRQFQLWHWHLKECCPMVTPPFWAVMVFNAESLNEKLLGKQSIVYDCSPHYSTLFFTKGRIIPLPAFNVSFQWPMIDVHLLCVFRSWFKYPK